MKKLKLMMAAALVVSMGLSACGGSASSKAPETTAAAEAKAAEAKAAETKAAETKAEAEKEASGDDTVYNLKVGIQQASTHSYTLAFEEFKKNIEERTDGRIQVELFPDSVLGSEGDMQEMVSAGDLEMCPSTFLVQYDPIYAMLEMPYVFDDFDHVKRFFNSDACQSLYERLVDSKKIRILTYFGNGFRQITNNKKPINHPEDLKGLSLRTPENQAQIETFKLLESVVTPLAFTELYNALQQGVVDGQENPIQQIATAKFYEVQKYMAMTNHMFNPGAIIVNETWYQSLPDDLRTILNECIREASDWQLTYVENSDADNLQLIIDNGVEVTYPDMDEFKEATAPVLDIMYKQLGDEAKELIEAIDSCRE